jgi:hypothetical protein
MRRRNSLLIACTLAACAAAAQAQTHTIDFDTDANGNAIAEGATIAEQYAPWGVHFVPNVLGGLNWSGAYFATNTDMTATASDFDPNFIASAAPADLPSGNLLGSYTGYLNSNGEPNYWVAFDKPVTNVSLDVYSAYSIQYGAFSLDGLDSNYNLVSYLDYANEVVSSTQTSAQVGLNNNDPISYLVVTGSIDEQFAPFASSGLYDLWLGVDNLTFTTVPEPGVYALLGSLGLTGATFLRRRRSR